MSSDPIYRYTVIVSVLVLPGLSVAVTVITLLPLDKVIPEIDQLVVPLAVPLPPRLLLHVTLCTPLELSDVLPPQADCAAWSSIGGIGGWAGNGYCGNSHVQRNGITCCI